MKDKVGARATITMKWPQGSCCKLTATERCELTMLEATKYMVKSIDTFAKLKYNGREFLYDTQPHCVPHAIGVTLNSELLWEIDACSEHVAQMRIDCIQDEMTKYLNKEVGSDVEVIIDVDEFIDESEFW